MKFVRPKIEENLHPDFIKKNCEKHSYCFNCMSADGIGLRQVIDGTLNTRKNIDTIL